MVLEIAFLDAVSEDFPPENFAHWNYTPFFFSPAKMNDAANKNIETLNMAKPSFIPFWE